MIHMSIAMNTKLQLKKKLLRVRARFFNLKNLNILAIYMFKKYPQALDHIMD